MIFIWSFKKLPSRVSRFVHKQCSFWETKKSSLSTPIYGHPTKTLSLQVGQLEQRFRRSLAHKTIEWLHLQAGRQGRNEGARGA